MPSTFTDSSGNNYHLAVVTGADWTVNAASMPNGDPSISGDGSINPVFNMNPQDFHLANGSPWTVEVWMRYTTGSANAEWILSTGISGSSTEAWFLVIANSESVALSLINTGGTNYMSTSTPGSLATNTWHHVVFVKQAGASLSAYLNGSIVTTVTATSGTPRNPLVADGYKLHFGARADNNFGLGSAMGPRIGKLLVFPAALTATQIMRHYLSMVTS